jgi:hypothetical protein
LRPGESADPAVSRLKDIQKQWPGFFGVRPTVQRLEFEGLLESMALLASGPREYPWVTEYPDAR